jgi:hypothetical protein
VSTVAVGIAAMGLVPAPGIPAETGCGGAKLVYLHTLHIEAKPRAKSYPRGDTVVVDVLVTRPDEEDPAGEGHPVPRVTEPEPAADVDVGITLFVGNSYAWDLGKTDEEGKEVLEIPTKKDFDTGWGTAHGYAEKVHYNNNGCPDVREVDYKTWPRFVRITG